MNPLAAISQRARSIIRRFSVLRLSGPGGACLPLLGDDSYAQSLGSRYLGTGQFARRRRPRLRPLVGTAEREARRYGACVLSNLRTARPVEQRALRIPWFVELEVPLPPDLEEYRATLPKTLRNDTRRCEKLFVAEFSSDPASLDIFLRDFHAPTIRNRYGEEGIVSNLPRMRETLAEGDFMKILHQGRWIAGQLTSRAEGVARLCQLGLLGGDRDALPNLATTAIYWFSIRRAVADGCHTLQLGGTTPALEAGVHRFKSQWNARANAAATHRAPQFLFLDPSHPACQAFLGRNTIYFWDGDGLSLLGRAAGRAELEAVLLRDPAARAADGIYSVHPGVPDAQRLRHGPGVPAHLRGSIHRLR